MKTKIIKQFIQIVMISVFTILITSCSLEEHVHSYDCMDPSYTYLKREADCESSALYYYSCSCGKKGTGTFIYGEKKEHPFAEKWSFDEDAHWHASTCDHDVKTDVSTHDWNEGNITLEPTETTKGIKTYKCVVCGAEKEEEIPTIVHEHTFEYEWSNDEYVHWHASTCEHDIRSSLAVHSWDNGTVITEATENNDGKTSYTCVICGYVYIKTIPAIVHEHTYNDVWSKDEYVHWYAANCGHDIKINLAVHNWDKGTIISAPTENNEGEILYTCVFCGYEKTEIIPILVHTHTYNNNWSSDENIHWHAANCDDPECQKNIQTDIAVHSWNDGIVIVAPTESSEGETHYTCVICGYLKVKTIPALAHTHTYDSAWSHNGNIHWHDATCEHISERTDVAVHTWDDGVTITEPTENNTGEIHYTCVFCDYTKIEIIPALVHNHTYSNDWNSNEYIHWHDATCGHDVKIDISAHIWGEKIISTPATEGSTGLYTFNCVICGKEKTEIIPMISHNHSFENGWTSDDDTHWHSATCGHDIKSDIAVHIWDAGTVITEATETKEGEMLYKCLICKAQVTKVIPVKEHVHTYENVWSFDEYIHWHKADCGHDEKINIAAHIWGESVITTPATEESTGLITYKCVMCNFEKNEVIPKLEHYHTYDDSWTHNDSSHWRVATCSHTGEVVGMADHLWNNGVITVSPTETTPGEITYTCIVCEYNKTDILPILNHTHSFTLKTTNYLHIAADCTHKATYYYSCICGEKGDALFEYGDVLAHKYINYTSDGNATCSEDGTKTAKCENCEATNTIADTGSKLSHTYSTEWTSDDKYHWHAATCGHNDSISGMASHDWDSGVITLQPTENAEGVMTYTCIECSKRVSETIPKLEHVHKYIEKTNEYLAVAATCLAKARYYYSCSCGDVGNTTYEYGSFATHVYTDYVYNNNATCSTDGTETAVCNTLGCYETHTLVAIGTKLPHSFSDTWTSDTLYHWHSSTCGHNDQIADKEEHQWDAGVIIKHPTETEDGEKLFTCVICRNSKIEIISDEHVHSFTQKTNEHLASAATCEHKATYYYTCLCGEVSTITYEYGPLASHTYSDYVSNNDATCGNDGTKTRICSVCGHEDTITDIGSKLPHTYADEWSYDGDKHWHAATCEHSTERADVGDHDWDEGVVILEPTETSTGQRLHTCSVCETTKTEIIPVLEHVHTFSDEWSYDANKHWHAATCSHINEKSDEESHNFILNVEHSVEPTLYEDGINVYVCSECEYVKEEIIDKIASFTVIFYDSTYNVISEKNYALGTTNITVPTAPVKVGYSFIEWVNASDETTLEDVVFANAAENDVYVFNPVYLKRHTVTLVDNNNNVLGVITVLDSQHINSSDLPEIPERIGYTAYWDSSITTSLVTEDMTISPVYNIINFEVTFLDKDGKPLTYVNEKGENITIQIVNYGSFANIPEYPQYWFDTTTLRLYEFTGWSHDVENITENHIGNNAIKALYEKEVDYPVIAIKISGNTAKISITLPKNAELYSLKLSAKWNNNNGLCGITAAQLETISSLNKDACGDILCTVGDKNGESGWFTYNNKNNTFDFLWTCGNGHSVKAENVITLTFESPSPSFVLDESIFEILSDSSIIYGDSNANITELQKADVFVWFYK